MIKKNNNGFYYESEKSGRTYELLEGFSLGSGTQYTSDIIAIFYSGNVDIEDPSVIIGHYWGAASFEPDDENEAIIKEIVEKYENENIFYVNTDDPSDIVTLEEIYKRYIDINGSDSGFYEYKNSGFYDGIYQEYKKI